MLKTASLFLGFICLSLIAIGQIRDNPFQPFTWEWPTPNTSRLGSGAPGPDYWQQKVDYKISVELFPEEKRLTGKETITYHNQSPHKLKFLWLQLDQDVRRPASARHLISQPDALEDPADVYQASRRNSPADYGFKIGKIEAQNGSLLKYYVGETNLRIELEKDLAAGEDFTFRLDWSYLINDATVEGRCGYEFFLEDENFIFEIAQFYPRMCAYDDVKGWQNRPFYGSAEFALDFGDFDVEITAPDNFVVPATGTLENHSEVLNKDQRKRLAKIRSESGEVGFVISEKEAEKNEEKKAKGKKTWKYKAEKVRDFAFAASKKFIWDAGVVEIGGNKVLVQSFYPKEAMSLWSKYATHTAMHTLETYSKYSLNYPYPQATVVHGPVWGMEYPMVSFCGGRPSSSGYYSRSTKYRMIGVIIHEVGHNFFPMIVNSDERRWAWMDEGLNSFLEYLTEREWEPGFPHRRGPADDYAFNLLLFGDESIMTNVESIRSNGIISYGKTAAGLYLLRELVLGPANFDFAFKEYATRWAFKRPEPSDFFRSIEDASGQDLDWFWREWFYGTDPIDFGIQEVEHFVLNKSEGLEKAKNLFPEFERGSVDQFYIDGKPALQDEFTGKVKTWDKSDSQNEKNIAKLVADHEARAGDLFHLYEVTIVNKGGCTMPVVMDAIYTDGSRESYRIPAQVWFQADSTFRHEFRSTKEVVAFHLDGLRILSDADRSNNLFPQTSLGQSFKKTDWTK